MSQKPRILYCHCAYARVVPEAAKKKVLEKLCEAGVSFDSVADLCEMSARRDPSLKRLAGEGEITVAACYPRAVRWLFSAAGAPLPKQGVKILNMRAEEPEQIVEIMLSDERENTAAEQKEAS
ncbi:MAG TPA: hypothetical protein VMN76_09470 [Acidobacteriota bacterium]|nr:hypothetical protein [Acidobacteriota bacterium]